MSKKRQKQSFEPRGGSASAVHAATVPPGTVFPASQAPHGLRLPLELRLRVERERQRGATWEEIEDLLPGLEEWQTVAEAVRERFPAAACPAPISRPGMAAI